MSDPIPIEAAREQHATLAGAAKDSPVRHYRYVLKAQADEWASAVELFEGMEGEGVIELAGTLAPGMFLAHYDQDGRAFFFRINRRTRGEGLSYELDNPDGYKPYYRGFGSVMSPAVVRR